MIMPDNETSTTEQTSSPAGVTSRRQAIGAMGTAVSATMVAAAMPALDAQAQTPAGAPLRMPVPPPVQVPAADLVDVLEFETQARLVLGPAKLAPLLGSDRTVTDRITLRPRMNIPTTSISRRSLSARLPIRSASTPMVRSPWRMGPPRQMPPWS